MRRSPHDRRSKYGSLLNPNLNPNYTFENFVVGSCNQFAQAAASAVVKNPAKSYNPLYIYGGAGLGKTHLMNAIGHHVLKDNRRLKVLYITTEKFMNDLINHLQYGKVLDFRQKYRSIDVLLMDDIHYLSGRERTKEEFFHTFNHLYDSQKQIVITSDCPPKEIPNLEERFSSRFEWGLIADLKPPDIETRIAILKKKSELEEIHLSESVALFIADREDGHNIGVAQAGCRLRFSQKPLDEIHVGAKSRRQHLDGNPAVERMVPGFVDDTHPTLAEHFHNLIRSKRFADQVVCVFGRISWGGPIFEQYRPGRRYFLVVLRIVIGKTIEHSHAKQTVGA